MVNVYCQKHLFTWTGITRLFDVGRVTILRAADSASSSVAGANRRRTGNEPLHDVMSFQGFAHTQRQADFAQQHTSAARRTNNRSLYVGSCCVVSSPSAQQPLQQREACNQLYLKIDTDKPKDFRAAPMKCYKPPNNSCPPLEIARSPATNGWRSSFRNDFVFKRNLASVFFNLFCCSGTFRKCLRCSWNPMELLKRQ